MVCLKADYQQGIERHSFISKRFFLPSSNKYEEMIERDSNIQAYWGIERSVRDKAKEQLASRVDGNCRHVVACTQNLDNVVQVLGQFLYGLYLCGKGKEKKRKTEHKEESVKLALLRLRLRSYGDKSRKQYIFSFFCIALVTCRLAVNSDEKAECRKLCRGSAFLPKVFHFQSILFRCSCF